jgi:hypothetical protein
MKINPKIPFAKSASDSMLEKNSGNTQNDMDDKTEQKVFRWNASKMSYETPDGFATICSLVQMGDSEFATKEGNNPQSDGE